MANVTYRCHALLSSSLTIRRRIAAAFHVAGIDLPGEPEVLRDEAQAFESEVRDRVEGPGIELDLGHSIHHRCFSDAPKQFPRDPPSRVRGVHADLLDLVPATSVGEDIV